jgi:hypothetical protein
LWPSSSGLIGVRGEAAFRLRILHVVEVWLFVPRTTFVLTLGEVEPQLHCLIRRNVSEERIVQLAHLIEGFHEHIGVRDLPSLKRRNNTGQL